MYNVKEMCKRRSTLVVTYMFSKLSIHTLGGHYLFAISVKLEIKDSFLALHPNLRNREISLTSEAYLTLFTSYLIYFSSLFTHCTTKTACS